MVGVCLPKDGSCAAGDELPSVASAHRCVIKLQLQDCKLRKVICKENLLPGLPCYGKRLCCACSLGDVGGCLARVSAQRCVYAAMRSQRGCLRSRSLGLSPPADIIKHSLVLS